MENELLENNNETKLSEDEKADVQTAVNNILENKKDENELDTAIDSTLAVIPLEQRENELVQQIITAPTKEELQQQFELFNINQAKKNALRVIKLNNLLDKVEDQAIERFSKRPDQVSNRELIDYMNAVSNQIERAQKSVDALSTDTSPIKITNQKNEVNINVSPTLDKDGKEHVIDAINALLKQIKQKPSNDIIVEDSEIIDVTPTESIENTEVLNTEIVYNDDTTSENIDSEDKE